MNRAIITAVVLCLTLVGGCDVYREQVLGNREHNVACKDLPTRAAADEILRTHHDMVKRITQLREDGSISIELAEPCPGRADLVIYYPSAAARSQIEGLIGAESFYGIPFRLVNV